jgi:tetratricopeptide (TPR) repeat protein
LNLYDVLTQQGHKVFIDQVVLKAGDQLARRLEDALASSQAAVLVWSSATADSEWVHREYEVLERFATDKPGFQFVPVRLDNSKLPLFAASRIFLDFASYPDGPNGGELLRLLHGVVGQSLSTEAAKFASEQDEKAQEASAAIGAAIQNGRAARLTELYEAGGSVWRTSSALGCKAAEGLTKLDHNDEAIALLDKIRKDFPKAVRPKQLFALALARRGKGDDLDRAQEILGELYQQKQYDPETLGIYGRTWMDRYAQSKNVNDLLQSRDLYVEAFSKAPDDYYTGINAAAKSVFLGGDENLQAAAKYAGEVQKLVGTQAREGDYWMTATVAEVFLMQKKYPEAGQMYEKAVAMARQRTGDLKTTWKQACRLMEKLAPRAQERATIRRAFAQLPDCDQV